MRSWIVAGVIALGCGRVQFEDIADAAARSDTSDALVDAIDPIDAIDAMCSTVRIPIADPADDGEVYFMTFFPGGEQPADMAIPWAIYFGHWTEGPTWAYFRFAVPPGHVTSATLELWAESTTPTWDPQTHALRIVAEATTAAAVVTNVAEAPRAAQGRPVTSAVVRWPASGGLAWPLATRVASPELRPLFDELGVLPAGAFVQLWIEGDFEGTLAEVGTPDSSIDATHAAELVATVCP